MSLLNPKSNGKYKEFDWWKNKIIVGDAFFHDLLNHKEKDWTSETINLEKWLDVFVKKILRIDDSLKSDSLSQKEKKHYLYLKQDYERSLEQWTHALKLLLCAKYVAENDSAFPAVLESPREKIEFTSAIQKELSNFLQKVFSKKVKTDNTKINKIEITTLERDEIILFCSLFCGGNLADNFIEVPFATASSPETGAIHKLVLKKVQSFGLVRRNPCVFPEVHNYAKKIDPNFSEAVEAAFLFNSQSWADEQMEQKFGRFGKYGIIWDVKPFYNNAEKSTLAEAVTEQKQRSDNKINGEQKLNQEIETLYGESIGLAAAVGIYFALRDKYPDERVIYSAGLSIDNRNRPTGKIAAVDGIPAKINAAIDSTIIDTFVIHQDNFKDKDREKIEPMLIKRHFRIKTLDSDANEVETFPAPT